MFSNKFTVDKTNEYLSKLDNKEFQSKTDEYLYDALKKFPIKNKQVSIFHSTTPWYESLSLSEGAYPTTISRDILVSEDLRLNITNQPEENSFDAAFMLLQLKTLGLKFPLNPNADYEAMDQAKRLLKKTGLLYLSIPVGICLSQTPYRIYGEKRMKTLFKGWRPLGYFGYCYEDLSKESKDLHEPVFVLKPLHKDT